MQNLTRPPPPAAVIKPTDFPPMQQSKPNIPVIPNARNYIPTAKLVDSNDETI